MNHELRITLLPAVFLLPLGTLDDRAAGQRVDLQPDCLIGPGAAQRANQEALDSHLLRRLDEASAGYRRVVQIDPPKQPTPSERSIALKFAPEVRITPSEPFRLIDVVAVLHPKAPWIAYHFFGEDDFDFPDDNDPCDHEVMWVQLDKNRTRINDYFTYFHGRLLRAPAEAVLEAEKASGRPLVEVQWGKHGTMPSGWAQLQIVADEGDAERDYYPVDSKITLETYNRGTFEKLSTEGRRSAGSPLGHGWPPKFVGKWSDFVDFSRSAGVLEQLREKRTVLVSPWNNAVLDQHLLTYNFRPKTEWPRKLCEDLKGR